MARSTAPTNRGRDVRHLGPRHWTWQARAILLSAIWGTSFLFMKEGDRSFVPYEVTSGRVAVGALTLVVVLVASRQPLPRGLRLWGHLAVAGLLMNAVPFTLIAWGEQRISSVAAGIWNATTPLFVVPVAFLLLPAERPTRARAAGLLVGFLGVAVVFGAWAGLPGSHLSGDLGCLGASACYGLGIPYARRFVAKSSASPTGLAAGQLIAATVELTLVSPLLAKAPVQVSAVSVFSIVALGAFGTGIAYVLNYSVIREAGATNASLVTYVIPIFSTILGITVLGEILVWNEPVGAAVILVGVAISQGVLARGRISWGREQPFVAKSGDAPPGAKGVPLPLAAVTTGELSAIDDGGSDE
jgi:drug/metabolite transporter (DMT)-like permease